MAEFKVTEELLDQFELGDKLNAQTSDMAPKLEQVRENFELSLEYDPEQPISLHQALEVFARRLLNIVTETPDGDFMKLRPLQKGGGIDDHSIRILYQETKILAQRLLIASQTLWSFRPEGNPPDRVNQLFIDGSVLKMDVQKPNTRIETNEIDLGERGFELTPGQSYNWTSTDEHKDAHWTLDGTVMKNQDEGPQIPNAMFVDTRILVDSSGSPVTNSEGHSIQWNVAHGNPLQEGGHYTLRDSFEIVGDPSTKRQLDTESPLSS